MSYFYFCTNTVNVQCPMSNVGFRTDLFSSVVKLFRFRMKICVWNPNKNDCSDIRKPNKTGWNLFHIQNMIPNHLGTIFEPLLSKFVLKYVVFSNTKPDWNRFYLVLVRISNIWFQTERSKSENQTCLCPDFGIVWILVIHCIGVLRIIFITYLGCKNSATKVSKQKISSQRKNP